MSANDQCRAVLVRPGQAKSAALGERPVPAPAKGQLLLKALEVGICGTDVEIDEGLYGEAPPGEDTLVLGHESLLEVAEVGAGVEGFTKGELAVAIVRRPCPELCPACAQGRWDMCVTGDYQERGIARLDGFMRQYLVDDAHFVVRVPEALRSMAVLMEPLTIVEKAVEDAFKVHPAFQPPRRALVTGAGPVGLLAALLLLSRGLEVWVLDKKPAASAKAKIVLEAGGRYVDDSDTPLEKAVGALRFDVAVEASGYAPLLFRAVNLLARNGVLVLTGVTGGHHNLEVDANLLNSNMVLENQAIVGSVNASRGHYEAAVRDMTSWKERFGSLPERIITGRFPLGDFRRALDRGPDAIKSVVEVSG